MVRRTAVKTHAATLLRANSKAPPSATTRTRTAAATANSPAPVQYVEPAQASATLRKLALAPMLLALPNCLRLMVKAVGTARKVCNVLAANVLQGISNARRSWGPTLPRMTPMLAIAKIARFRVLRLNLVQECATVCNKTSSTALYAVVVGNAAT